MPIDDENTTCQPVGTPKPSDVAAFEANGDIDALIRAAISKNSDRPDEIVCRAAVEALVRMGASVVEPLYERYKALPLTENFLVVEVLGKIGLPARETLITILNDWSKPHVHETEAQIIAAAYLGEIGGGQAVEALITAQRNINHPYFQEHATRALGKIGKDAIWPLVDALTNQHDGVRLLAAEALGKIGDLRAVGPLIAVLEYYPLGQSQIKFHQSWMGEPMSMTARKLSEVAATALETIGWCSSKPVIQGAVETIITLYDARRESTGLSQFELAIEKIGDGLLRQGNIDTMKEAHDSFACQRPQSAYHLARVWDRICYWRRHYEKIRDAITYY